MTEDRERLLTLTKARGDVEAERKCLRCGVHFLSTGFGERICGHCKRSATWRSSLPAGSGPVRRRASGVGPQGH